MGRSLRLGLFQLSASPSKRENLEKIEKVIAGSSADLVIVPEYSMANITGLPPSRVYELSESLEGPFVERVRRAASEASVHVVATLFERSGRPPKVYNTAVLISPDGGFKAVYRKIHLFDAYGYRESEYMLHGEVPSPVVDVGGTKVALAICFDIRFPELFRLYALRGAELVVVPSAWYTGPMKEETMLFLARARAHENTVYVAMVNQYGRDFTGRSVVVDPMGAPVLELGVGEKYVEYTIDADYVYEVRKMLPMLKLRRPEAYGRAT